MEVGTPFFIINPKNFLNYEQLDNLAAHANSLAQRFNVTVFFTAPSSYLHMLAQKNESLIITAQNISVHDRQDTMGDISFRNLNDMDVQAVVLNHAEAPLTLSEIVSGINLANDRNIISIVCANSVQEAKMIALCDPTIILAEQTELIGGNQISDDHFLKTVIREVKAINPEILVEYGAGIRSPKDVKRLLNTGVDGVGATSGIVKADDPHEMVEKMLNVIKTKKEKGD